MPKHFSQVWCSLALGAALLAGPAIGQTYLPISYKIPYGSDECIYERVEKRGEHLTSSVFLVSGEELRAAFVLEGPVAPIDTDLNTGKSAGGVELQSYLSRYEKEGVNMFVNFKSDSMINVKPIRIAEMLDFEDEEEDYFDDQTISEAEREAFNAEHDIEHQHRQHDPQVQHERGRRRDQEQHGGDDEEPEHYDDDYTLMKEEALRRQVEEEAEYDDDFVKLQMDNVKPAPSGRRTNEDTRGRRRLQEQSKKLVAGEPYQRTIQIESPGWYRVCVSAKFYEVEVEMELRKGQIDRHTGHVRSLEDVEIHSEIKGLYEKEDDAEVLREEGLIKDEDLRVSKEQLRILENVYSQIIGKQMEERRTWDWRTIKNQHIYSHLVMGNLVETIVYMMVTGFQVYTIRKWFSSQGPALGR